MRLIGIIILGFGLILGTYALTMDVGIDVPARDFGYGVSTPAMKVANLDLMNQRQNYLIFAGILSVVGVVLTGFASTRANAAGSKLPVPAPSPSSAMPARPVADGMKLCPYCAEEVRMAATKCKHCQSDLPIAEAPVETGSPHIKYYNGLYMVGGYSFDKLEQAQECLAQWSGPKP
jgi:hypothetical protein